MAQEPYSKLSVGDLGYIHPSTAQSEWKAGVVVEVQRDAAGGPPHIGLQFPDGTRSGLLDYNRVGYGGPPPTSKNGTAVVKWLFDPETWEKSRGEQRIPSPINANEHRKWPILQVFGTGWALVRDEWGGRSHWLASGGSEYTFVVSGNRKVAATALLWKGFHRSSKRTPFTWENVGTFPASGKCLHHQFPL